jgi:hypothetical protein
VSRQPLFLPLALVAKLLDVSEEAVRKWRLTKYQHQEKPAYDWREAYARDLEKRAGPSGRGFPRRDTVVAAGAELCAQAERALKRRGLDELERLVAKMQGVAEAAGIDLEADA